MKMTFGKYRGVEVADVPTDYLRWCLGNVSDMDFRLRQAIVAELQGPKPAPTATTAPAVPRARIEEGLKNWYRRMSLKYHPDRGGSNEIQIVVNDCYHSLSALIGEMGGSQ